jgi:hypothetical protein
MIGPVLYYLVIPFLIGATVVRLLQKHGRSRVDPRIAALFTEKPIEKKWFRAVKRDEAGFSALGDYETHGETVEAAYRAKEQTQAAGKKASFFIVNDKAEVLEQVDS